MPWREHTSRSERQEFVRFAREEGATIAALGRGFGLSRKTGDTWLARAGTEGASNWADHARRPHTSPRRTPAALEAQILDLRTRHPRGGGRTRHHGLGQHGHVEAPAPSTITAIRARHGLITPDPEAPRRLQRCEPEAPTDLWPLDFRGHRPLADGQRVQPLTLLDDHARFALALLACPHERQDLVQAQLIAWFRRDGLPQAILTANGPPGATSGAGGLTAREAWLLRLGVELWHGRADHPQTHGQVERRHGTIAAEVFAHHHLPHLAACQPAFDAFRHVSNHERPPEALAYAVPVSRYTPSPRPFPATLPDLTDGPGDQVRLVRDQGAIFVHNRSWFVSRGLIGLPVAVRPTTTDGRFQVGSCQREVAPIDLTDRTGVSPLSSHPCYLSLRSEHEVEESDFGQ